MSPLTVHPCSIPSKNCSDNCNYLICITQTLASIANPHLRTLRANRASITNPHLRSLKANWAFGFYHSVTISAWDLCSPPGRRRPQCDYKKQKLPSHHWAGLSCSRGCPGRQPISPDWSSVQIKHANRQQYTGMHCENYTSDGANGLCRTNHINRFKTMEWDEIHPCLRKGWGRVSSKRDTPCRYLTGWWGGAASVAQYSPSLWKSHDSSPPLSPARYLSLAVPSCDALMSLIPSKISYLIELYTPTTNAKNLDFYSKVSPGMWRVELHWNRSEQDDVNGWLDRGVGDDYLISGSQFERIQSTPAAIKTIFCDRNVNGEFLANSLSMQAHLLWVQGRALIPVMWTMAQHLSAHALRGNRMKT